jgi:hypothetical protein
MPPPGASGVSWQSAELMRKYLNGLRRNAVNAANSSRDFTDAAGMRYVLDEFDQILGKSNPLLNEARAAHAERLKTFDPDRKTGPEGLRAVMQTAGRTGEGGNTGINLYNKLFSGTKMSKGQVEAQLDHLKKIFADDPTGMQAIKEGALQRIFYNDNNVLRTPKQTATAIRDALEGNGKDTYRGLFVPEELNALRRHQERLNVVGDKQTARNPSKTSYNQNSTASRKYLMSAGAGAGAWLGHSTGIPYMGEIGAMMGAGAAPLVEAGMNMRSAGKARQMSFPTQQMYSPILAITPPAATASQIAPRNVSISPENRRRGGHLRSVRSR